MNTIDIQAEHKPNFNPNLPRYMTARKFSPFSGLPYRLVLELLKSGDLEGFKSGTTYYVLVESYKGLAHPLTGE